MAHPPGMNVFALTDMDFVEGFMPFRTLAGVRSSPLIFGGIVRPYGFRGWLATDAGIGRD